MALTVEDGSIVAGANTYASESDLTAYAALKGVTIAGDNSELLFRAAVYVESLNFIGQKLTKLQKMQWPRSGVYIDGFAIATDEIPELLINLQMEAALSVDEGFDPMSTVTQTVKREKVDVIEVEYMDGSSASPRLTSVYAMANKLIGRSVGGSNFTVTRR